MPGVAEQELQVTRKRLGERQLCNILLLTMVEQKSASPNYADSLRHQIQLTEQLECAVMQRKA